MILAYGINIIHGEKYFLNSQTECKSLFWNELTGNINEWPQSGLHNNSGHHLDTPPDLHTHTHTNTHPQTWESGFHVKMSTVGFDRPARASKVWIALRRLDKNGMQFVLFISLLSSNSPPHGRHDEKYNVSASISMATSILNLHRRTGDDLSLIRTFIHT